MTVLFWVVMAGVLVYAWPEFREWREVRAFRKQLEDRSDFPVKDEASHE